MIELFPFCTGSVNNQNPLLFKKMVWTSPDYKDTEITRGMLHNKNKTDRSSY